MQSRINSFFKPCSSPSSFSSSAAADAPCSLQMDEEKEGDLAVWENTHHVIINTYQRRAVSLEGDEAQELTGKLEKKPKSYNLFPRPQSHGIRTEPKKKRSYAQFHLELGQSDFVLRTCTTCAFKYAPGDEADEGNHEAFHNDYIRGIRFKGWQRERVIHIACPDRERVLVVLDTDPPAHRNKVQEVVKMMEIELGEDRILHKLCKVYLYISSQRIVGCLVAEPIKKAFRVLSSSKEEGENSSSAREKRSPATSLHFGTVILQRQMLKKSNRPSHISCGGVLICESEATQAVCGIRAIWITPSNRRKRIATRLLDALRKSFSNSVLQKSQMAISQPSVAGNLFASSYFGTACFLVYKAGNELKPFS